MADSVGEGVTLLGTDIEGSTALWQQYPDAMPALLARHDAILRGAIAAHGGVVLHTAGDAFYATFPAPAAALAAAVAAQREIQAEFGPRPGSAPPALRVRMGLYTGLGTEDAESGGRALIRVGRVLAAGHGGQILLSQATQQRVDHHLPAGTTLRDLGEHRLRDLNDPEQIFQLVIAGLPADFPPLRALAAFHHNLPVQSTRFIGRQDAIAEVTRLLAPPPAGTRLVTLTGPGGTGKTRLALEVAAHLLDHYPDGVWVAELASLQDSGLVLRTVAAVVGLSETPGRPLLSALGEYLRDKRLLLVLDNCEHLVLACAQLADALLRACPQLQILTSSREALGIAGETQFRVPPLTIPEPRRLPPLAALARYEAIALFVDRAAAIQAGFTLDESNALAVAQICRRLDGIPLAIELAAAQVRYRQPAAIAAGLTDRFRLLTGSDETILPRQHTLQALIGWSYDLLNTTEQTLLQRLAVFAGGWTLDGAEAVCADADLDIYDVLDLQMQLINKSLVMTEDHGDVARYHMLETIRQYGQERLLAAGGAGGVRARHLAYFRDLVEAHELDRQGAQQIPTLARLDQEHDNLRLALAWAETTGDAESLARMATALSRFWILRGYWGEGRRWMEAAVSAAAALPETIRGRLLFAAGNLALNQSDFAQAVRWLQESLACSRALGDTAGMAQALLRLGAAALDAGTYAEAVALYEESRALFQQAGHMLGLAQATRSLSRAAAFVGEWDTARARQEQALALFRELGNASGVGWALHDLGSLAANASADYPRAAEHYQAALQHFRALGARVLVAATLVALGHVLLDQGKPDEAEICVAEALGLYQAVGSPEGLGFVQLLQGRLALARGAVAAAEQFCLGSLVLLQDLGHQQNILSSLAGLAQVAAVRGQATRAVRLAGAVAARVESTGGCMPYPMCVVQAQALARARTALDTPHLTVTLQAGRALSLEQAIAEALAVEEVADDRV